jgi:hypothetical protein
MMTIIAGERLGKIERAVKSRAERRTGVILLDNHD